MGRPARLLAAALLVATATGCRSSAPVTMVLGRGEVLRGSATTSLNGQYFVQGAKTNCSGTFEGRNVAGLGFSVGRKGTVTAQCSNGKNGLSEDPFYNSGSARLRFNDGSSGTLSFDGN